MIQSVENLARLRQVRLGFVTALGVCWFALGFTSDNVPWFEEQVWVALCSMVAGAALALARWDSLFALSNYVVLASIVGTTRSLAYVSNGSWGPMWVWLIMGTTTLAAFLALTVDQRQTRRFRKRT